MNETKSNGRFKPGQSGNPAGRKPGQRHRSTVLLEKLMADDAKTIVKAVLTAAAAGDMTAARLVLDRVLPAMKDRPLSIELPAADTTEGVDKALCAVIAAVADGSLLLGEAAALSSLLEMRRKSIETNELTALVATLQQRKPI